MFTQSGEEFPLSLQPVGETPMIQLMLLNGLS
jgi:hypothetical protein